MKRWLKRSLIGLLGVSVLFGGIAAAAYRSHHWHTMSAEEQDRFKLRLVDKAASKLELDAAQKAKLALLADQLQLQRNQVMAGTDPRAALQAMVAGPVFDRTQAQAFVSTKTDAVREGSPALIAAVGDFYDSLRPEQQQQLRDLMARGRHGWRS
jgi:Spy/CpxP family protein refolding chaperone